jgi:hypothetical protein
VRSEHLGDDEDEVRRRRPARQRAVEADPDDVWHGLVERLAEQDGLRLDTADTVAQDAQAVDHGRMRIGADDGVRVCDPAAAGVFPIRDDRGQELQIDLVDDPGPGWHDAQIPERGLSPAQELVALAVAFVLALDVERERAGRPELVDLDRVVDDEVGRDERVDHRRVATQVGHRVTHDREVHDGRDAGEVLEEDPGRHEWDLGLRRDPRSPGQERLDIVRADDPAARMAEEILQQDLDRDGECPEVDPVGDGVQPVEVRESAAERRSCAEGVDSCQRVRPHSLATLDGCKRTAPGQPLCPAAHEGLGRPARRRPAARPGREGGRHRGGRHRPGPAPARLPSPWR